MIRALPDHLVNQIAAGEVVERPASVIKELAENAIDAGATKIDITLGDAGKTLIEVRDDGTGIAKDQLALAVTRHATSKLPEGDLGAVMTRGFRGEALPSIASVSDFTLTSRTADQDTAWTLSNQGGDWSGPRPAPGPVGTHIIVADLFRATPARLKFLKSDTAERTAIKATLTQLALSAPQVTLNLQENGKTLLSVPADPEARLRRLMGADFAGAYIDHRRIRGDVQVHVRAGLPTLNRATSAGLYFLVNDRPIQDKRLMGVVRAAYRDYVPKGRFPTLLAQISLPPDQVDVNVHPAKTEVRFRDPAGVSSALMGALKEALSKAPRGTSGHLGNEAQRLFQASIRHSPPPSPTAQQTAFGLQAQAPLNPPRPSSPGFEEDAAPIPSDQPLGTPLALLHKTYILSQTTDGFTLIDMHAAHERLVYERLKRQLDDGPIASQALLVPVAVDLEAEARTRILSATDALAKLGLNVEGFGPGTLLVRAVPALLAEKADWRQLILDLAELMSSEDGGTDLLEARLHEALASLACYTSVRSGRQLNLSEMDALLRQMEAEPASAQCNHGRPTSVALSLGQLERLFERA